VVDCVFGRSAAYGGVPGDCESVGCAYTALLATDFAFQGAVQFYGGIIAGGGRIVGAGFQLDTFVVGPPLVIADSGQGVGQMFVATDAAIITQGALQLSSGDILYGGGSLSASGVLSYEGSAVSTFPLAGGLSVGGSADAYSNSTTAGLTTVHRLAVTPAALDAPAGAAGFGGLAYVPSVAAITMLNQAP
jgi:hypothetical protein